MDAVNQRLKRGQLVKIGEELMGIYQQGGKGEDYYSSEEWKRYLKEIIKEDLWKYSGFLGTESLAKYMDKKATFGELIMDEDPVESGTGDDEEKAWEVDKEYMDSKMFNSLQKHDVEELLHEINDSHHPRTSHS